MSAEVVSVVDDLVAQLRGLDREQAAAVVAQLEGALDSLEPDGGSGVDRGTRERLEGFIIGVRVGLAVD